MFKRTIAALLCALAALGLTGCGEKTSQDTIYLDPAKAAAAADATGPEAEDPELPVPSAGETDGMDGQLIATVQTREEADRIAELYGIELVDFAAPAALYKTREDPQTVIQRGIDNGWPILELNHVKNIY